MGKLTEYLLHLPRYPQPRLIALRYPVLLMHGFGAIGSINRPGMLHGIAMALRSSGVKAYATNVEPYQRVSVRAHEWREAIQHITAETGARRVHLVAQSMGGLDARYMISHLDVNDRIRSLTTVSTPHHGSGLAQFMLDQPSRRLRWATRLMNTMSEVAYEGASPDATAALEELTPGYIQDVFNPDTPDDPSIEYRSWSARAGKGTDVRIHPSLVYANRKLYEIEGLNDGIVSVESGKWTGFQGVIDADHARQVEISLWRSSFVAIDFYTSVVESLVTIEESTP